MKIQMIMAHPDDEVIFGWPVLQCFSQFISEIIFVADDSNNLDRTWCSHRLDAAKELGCELGFTVRSLGYNSEFYRLPTKDEQLKRLMEKVAGLVDPDAIVFTHNFWGEYGHLDHIVTHMAVRSKAKSMTFTDIMVYSNWMYFKNKPKLTGETYGYFGNQMVLYDQHKAYYDRLKVWTWNQEAVKGCRLYKIDL